LQGKVAADGTTECLRYEADLAEGATFEVCPNGSLDEFLLDRYTAFTSHRSKHRFFRIWHEPWRQAPVHVTVSDDSLITGMWRWFAGAELIGGNYSPGARDVWMGRPHRIKML
jgi:uncharacterized protein YqjF (DUF2071 family)